MESVFKVIIVGEPKVGKTSFVSMYCHREWLGNYKPTTGADFAVKSIRWSDTESVRLHLWDIAGQDYARLTARTYYKGASGCIIMFDLTSRKTLEESQHWKRDVQSKVFLKNGQPIPCVLVANKDDLPNKVVSGEEVESFARDNEFAGRMCVSVKQNRHLTEAMQLLVEKMLEYDHETRDVTAGEMPAPLETTNFGGSAAVGEGQKIRLGDKQGDGSGSGGGCCYSSRGH